MSGPMLDVGAILDNAKELDRLKKELEEVLLDINKIHKKMQSAPEMHDKQGESVVTRLRELYAKAKELSETEVNITNTLISQLDALPLSGISTTQRKKMEINEQKKKRIKVESDVPKGVPAVRNQLEHPASLKGEQVAARVTLDHAEKDEWVVVKVIHFDREAKEFDVLDEEPGDDEESVQRQLLVLLQKKSDEYLLEFDDDEEEDGTMPKRAVPFYNVVPLPDGHRQ